VKPASAANGMIARRLFACESPNIAAAEVNMESAIV
jgi:hypothetical protein